MIDSHADESAGHHSLPRAGSQPEDSTLQRSPGRAKQEFRGFRVRGLERFGVCNSSSQFQEDVEERGSKLASPMAKVWRAELAGIQVSSHSRVVQKCWNVLHMAASS